MAMGFSNLPTSPTSIQRMVMEHGVRIRSFITGEISEQKKQGHQFSLTFDEWTSNRNRRYMCINLHGNRATFWSLGMVSVHGSLPADKCITLLNERLLKFALKLDSDIICICTDGASVMVKVGKLINADQQLCFAHAIQLAVLDVLHKCNQPPSMQHEVYSGVVKHISEDSDNENLDAKIGDIDNESKEESLY